MKTKIMTLAITALSVLATPVFANDRYLPKPPVVLSPNLTSAWTLQLGAQPGPQVRRHAVQPTYQQRPVRRIAKPQQRRVLVKPRSQQVAKKNTAPQIPQQFLPQMVSYNSSEKPGTIIIDTASRHLYLVLGNGKARRYGVGVGKTGFSWSGTEKISRKAQWPSWRPPAEMIAREKKKGRNLPTYMEGGPQNPLGARALYLGSTLYRIHGTNQPWTIGQAVSSGCIRMRNQDVIDLYERARVGAKVRVI